MPSLEKRADARIRVTDRSKALAIGYAFQEGNWLRIGKMPYKVIRQLGRGSCGDVYEVEDLRGKRHAMKHQYYHFATNPAKYHFKLQLLAAHTNPHPAFVWIKAVSDYDPATKSFLYIMPLVPKGYLPLARAVIDRKLLTMEQRLSVCRQLAEAFTELRKKKWVFGDCSSKNILFKPKRSGNPEVLIIDCDTISLETAPFGLEGSGCYRAPEILLSRRPTPTLNSDAHALAAVAFHLLIGTNPLDGAKVRKTPFSEAAVLHHYGEKPVYIFDPCGENKPLSPVLRSRFNQLPPGLQNYFNKIFSQDCLQGRVARPGPDVLLQSLSKK